MTTLVVTRPRHEAERWRVALEAAGWPVVLLPLIEIVPAPDAEALARCRERWASYDAVMFVSAQAVAHFLPQPVTSWPLRCWAPGPGTASTLQQAGVPVDRIDAPDPGAPQFDSEALWARVREQVAPGHRLLVVRGCSEGRSEGQGNGRDWLAEQCRAAGGQVDWCVAYQRRCPVWGTATRAQAAALVQDHACWLFSSSQAVGHLHQLCPDQRWEHARALVTHPRIGASVRELGFGEIIDSRPALADVLSHLESLH
ncbi:MAG TPA: uroporphyrinogen-III synthase [Macromonas sp.]|nr:uroporphyrinogen-III synthase [Macromonas sp.]